MAFNQGMLIESQKYTLESEDAPRGLSGSLISHPGFSYLQSLSCKIPQNALRSRPLKALHVLASLIHTVSWFRASFILSGGLSCGHQNSAWKVTRAVCQLLALSAAHGAPDGNMPEEI